MDEFADLEKELNEDIRSFNLEELIIEIEQGNSDFVLTRHERIFTPKMKKISLAVHIVLIPFFGLGLILLLIGLLPSGRYRTLNENTTHIHSTAFVKKHNLIVDYKMKNGIVQKTKSAIIESHSYILRTDASKRDNPFILYRLINPNTKPFTLLNDDWDDFESVEKTMRDFSTITNLEIENSYLGRQI